MGGYVALAFAARHPARLERLILADTRAAADSDAARAGRADALALVQKQGVAALVERQLGALLSPAASEAVREQVRILGKQSPAGVSCRPSGAARPAGSAIRAGGHSLSDPGHRGQGRQDFAASGDVWAGLGDFWGAFGGNRRRRAPKQSGKSKRLRGCYRQLHLTDQGSCRAKTLSDFCHPCFSP
jgi:pimeloyl-ACP methyl ester carboxylesterase